MAAVLAAGAGAATACGCSGGAILAAGACCSCVCDWKGAGCAALALPGAVVMRRVGAASDDAAACVLKRPEVGALRLILRCVVRGPTHMFIFSCAFNEFNTTCKLISRRRVYLSGSRLLRLHGKRVKAVSIALNGLDLVKAIRVGLECIVVVVCLCRQCLGRQDGFSARNKIPVLAVKLISA